MTIHHVIPQSEGGTLKDTIHLCQTCHRMLHYYIPIEKVRNYKAISDLENHPKFSEYLEWIRNKDHSSQYSIKKVVLYLKTCQLVA